MKKEPAIKLSTVDQNLISLLQDLIRIPSWVSLDTRTGEWQNENQIVDFLESWLQENTQMEVMRQKIVTDRFNLIAKKGKPDLVFLAHTDTVNLSENAPYNQLSATISDGEIWGRGATDMKSGIASMIQAISLSPEINNVWIFLYADEEYDFLGMKAVIKEYGYIRPKLIVSADGSDLQIGNSCRGLIEIKGRVIGKSGHAAKNIGKSAIGEGFETLNKLRSFLSEPEQTINGINSFNLAYVLGGAKKSNFSKNQNALIEVGQAGNVIADVMDFVLDVRPASPNINSSKLVEFIEQDLDKKGLKFQVIDKKHDLGAWKTPKMELIKYEKMCRKYLDNTAVVYSDSNNGGYLDLQMFWEAVGKPVSFMYGGGFGSTAHSANERISIKNLIKARDFFLELLKD